jgi:hypothetical protein
MASSGYGLVAIGKREGTGGQSKGNLLGLVAVVETVLEAQCDAASQVDQARLQRIAAKFVCHSDVQAACCHAKSVHEETLQLETAREIQERGDPRLAVQLTANALVLGCRFARSFVFQRDPCAASVNSERDNRVVVFAVAVRGEVVFATNLRLKLPESDDTRAPQRDLNLEDFDIVPDLIPSVSQLRARTPLDNRGLFALKEQLSVYAQGENRANSVHPGSIKKLVLRKPPDPPLEAVPHFLAESGVHRFVQLAPGQVSGAVNKPENRQVRAFRNLD